MPASITSFVRRTRLASRAWYGLAALTAHALCLVVVVQLVAWAFPRLLVPALYIAGAWLVALVAYGAFRPGLSLGAADGALGLGDRLVTWWGTRQRPPSAARSWLEADLETRLQAVPVRRTRDLWRRPARRLLWLLPLLLIAVWIGPLGSLFYLPSPFGLTERSADAPRREAGRAEATGGNGGEESDAGAEAAAPREPADRPPSQPPPPDAPPPDAPPPDAGPDPAPAVEEPAPAPIPDLPGQEEFVIPDFIGAGGGEERTTKVVTIDEPQAVPALPPPPSPGTPPPELPLPDRGEEEFEAARERALRSRLVPESERDFVRSYFEELGRLPR